MRISKWSSLIALTAATAAAACVAEPDTEESGTSSADILGAGTGLKGDYYDNVDFSAWKLTRIDPTIRFDWQSGTPSASIAQDTFSIRWTGKVEPSYSETYTFYVTSDDG